MVTINAEIGLITPPVGINLFVLKAAVPKLKLGDIIKGSMPFTIILLLALLIIVFFPQLALMLLK